MQEKKLWTPTRIIIAIAVAVVSLAFGIVLEGLIERVWPSQNSYASEALPSEQLYIPPPSTASPETVVIRSEPGAAAAVDPTFYLTVYVIDEQGNPLVAMVTVDCGCTGNEQRSTKDPAAQNFLAISVKCNGSEEDHEMLEVVARAEGYYPARQRFAVTVVSHLSYHLVLTLEPIAPAEAPRS